jgi:hypothetical protein
MNRFFLASFLILIAVCEARAMLPVASIDTATGQDRQQPRIEMGRRIQDALRAAEDDRKRWTLPIYSTSERQENLSLEVLHSAGMALRLSPAEGHLTISTPASKHVFAIAGAQGAGTICPKYNLYVTDASSEHILLKRVCRTFEYKPGRYAKSVTYYLYDQPTATMRDIWRASASGKDDPMPDADPPPVLKRLAGGYQFDWAGAYPGETRGQRHEVHNRFMRKLGGVQRTLACTDSSSGRGHGDASACEGEYLERIGG